MRVVEIAYPSPLCNRLCDSVVYSHFHSLSCAGRIFYFFLHIFSFIISGRLAEQLLVRAKLARSC
jgi:hypothetical protein